MVHVSNVDEESLAAANSDLGVDALALLLAQAKARDVAAHFASENDVVVVGCDSIFELDGEPFGKPLTADVARARIARMSGQSGHLHTGHWVVVGDRQVGRTTSTEIHFAAMDPAEIDAYVATGEPLNVAGSFTLDGLSAPFINSIVGDPSNVIGISLPTLRELLRDLGISWPAIWASP